MNNLLLLASDLEIKVLLTTSNVARTLAISDAISAYEHCLAATTDAAVSGQITDKIRELTKLQQSLNITPENPTALTLEGIDRFANLYWDIEKSLPLMRAVFQDAYLEAQQFIGCNQQYLSTGNPLLVERAINIIEEALRKGEDIVTYDKGPRRETAQELMDNLQAAHDWLVPKPHSRR